MKKAELLGISALVVFIVIVGITITWTLFHDSPGPMSIDSGEDIIPGTPIPASELEIIADIDGDHGEEFSPDLPETTRDTLGRVEGLVVDESSRPVKGARLSILRNRGVSRFAVRYKLKPLYRMRSGKDGTFTFGPLYAGTGYAIIVEHENFAEGMIENIYVAEGKSTRLQPIVLKRGITAFGWVRDDRGNALAGARVAVFGGTLRSSSAAGGGAKPERITLTNGKGHYRLENIQHSGFFIRASADGFASKVLRNSNPLSGAREFKLDFLLASEMCVTGRVVNEWDDPIEGVAIEAYRFRQSDHVPRRAISGKDGTFTIHGFDAGEYRIAFSHERYVTATHDRIAAGMEGLAVKLVRRTGLAGGILKPDGSPLKKFWINVKQIPRPGDLIEIGVHRKYSHERGRFVVDRLNPGTYVLEVAARGFAATHSGEIVVSGDSYADAGAIEILAGGIVSGTVLAPTGQPLGGVRVALLRNNYKPSRFEEAFGVTTTIRTRPVRTDANGDFRMESIPPGEYQLAFRHDSCPPLRLNGIVIADEALADLSLITLEAGGTIEGQVFAASGACAAGARVSMVRDDGTFFINVTTDSQGRFKATPIPAGTYTLTPEPARRDAKNFFGTPPPSPESIIKGIELTNGGRQYVTLQIVLKRVFPK
jgi:hypothetical protein